MLLRFPAASPDSVVKSTARTREFVGFLRVHHGFESGNGKAKFPHGVELSAVAAIRSACVVGCPATTDYIINFLLFQPKPTSIHPTISEGLTMLAMFLRQPIRLRHCGSVSSPSFSLPARTSPFQIQSLNRTQIAQSLHTSRPALESERPSLSDSDQIAADELRRRIAGTPLEGVIKTNPEVQKAFVRIGEMMRSKGECGERHGIGSRRIMRNIYRGVRERGHLRWEGFCLYRADQVLFNV